MGLGGFNGHVGKEIEGFEGVHGGYGIGERNAEGRMLLEFYEKKELCVANTWFQKKHNRKVTIKAGEFATEIDFVLIGKERRKYLKDIKTLAWELQHRLVVVDVDKKKTEKSCENETSCQKKAAEIEGRYNKRKERNEG